MQKPIFIAEIKTQSPFGYRSKDSFISLMDLALEHGDWISVHTNALWGGDFQALSFVRKFTNKPILAKGIHPTDKDIQRALDYGADYVLVVDRIPEDYNLHEKCLFECSYLNEFKKMVEDTHFHFQKHVYNFRHLRTGQPKKIQGIDTYLKFKPINPQFAPLDKLWICQASGIEKPTDVREGVSAYIVGEHLSKFCILKKHGSVLIGGK
jgi:indole-3-glycerol phosphate synthase